MLAIGSGLLIGTSFVFKKKGLLASQSEYQPDGPSVSPTDKTFSTLVGTDVLLKRVGRLVSVLRT